MEGFGVEKTWLWAAGLVYSKVKGWFHIIWGCNPAHGARHMFTIDSRMDAELHTSIHQVEFLATVEFYWSDRPWFTFQQENDPKDTFMEAPKWSQQSKVIVLKWPAVTWPQPFWMWVATPQMAAQCLQAPPAGVGELWGQVQMEWDRITKEVCRNLIESMPRRMQAMVRAKEGKTGYQHKNWFIKCWSL